MSENKTGLRDWDLSRYPKLKEMNDLTDEELSAYSEAAEGFYEAGMTWVENKPLDEIWLGS